MKKVLILLVCCMIFISACGGNDVKEKNDSNKNTEQVFKDDQENKVKIAKNPKRIVVLHPSYIGALVKFGHKPVAVPEFVKQNKVLNNVTKDAEKIDNTSIEQVAKQKPDLIIAPAGDKNIKKLKKVAPTVVFDSKKSNYKETTKKLASLVNEDKKANAWIKKWDKQMSKDKKELEPIIKDKTVSVLQQTPKGTMAFGDNLGRGTEILYGGYGMKRPEALAEATKSKSSTHINSEQFSEYIEDYVVIATQGEQKPDFEKTNYWKNLPAVKKENVIKFDVSETQYNDPISLERQRDILYKALNNNKS